jgi:MerR family transcriptional regulator, copper efflux regulator
MRAPSNRAVGLTVSKLARAAHVAVPTLRFYERERLLPEPARSAANYRVYSADAVGRIRFIRRAQQLGFTLAEIKDILNLRVSGDRSCAEVPELAEAKIAEIDARIQSLRKMGKALATLAVECGSEQSKKTCPILAHLEDNL